MKMIPEIKLDEIPEYGEKMTSKEFFQCVKDGIFNDYDGHGRYATKNKMTNIYVYPSDIVNIDIRWSHVIWFNK